MIVSFSNYGCDVFFIWLEEIGKSTFKPNFYNINFCYVRSHCCIDAALPQTKLSLIVCQTFSASFLKLHVTEFMCLCTTNSLPDFNSDMSVILGCG